MSTEVETADIEAAMATRLEAKGLSVGWIDVQKGVKGLKTPAAYVAAEQGSYTKITDRVYRERVTLGVYLIVKNFRDQKSRREGILPLVRGVRGILMGQKLGLDISPLVPIRWDETGEAVLQPLGLMAIRMEFQTSHDVARVDDADAGDDIALNLALKYFLRPGDEEVDLEGTFSGE